MNCPVNRQCPALGREHWHDSVLAVPGPLPPWLSPPSGLRWAPVRCSSREAGECGPSRARAQARWFLSRLVWCFPDGAPRNPGTPRWCWLEWVPLLGPAGRCGLPHALHSSWFTLVAAQLPPSRFVQPPARPSPAPLLFCPPVVVVPPAPSGFFRHARLLLLAGIGRGRPAGWSRVSAARGMVEPGRVQDSRDRSVRAACALAGWGQSALAGGGQAARDGGLARALWARTEGPWKAMVRRLRPLCDPTPALVPCCPGCLTEQSDRAWPGLPGLGTMAEPPRGLDGARAGTGRARGGRSSEPAPL